MTNNPAFDRLRRTGSAFQESCLLAAAAELDLFTEILKHGNHITVSELVRAIDADPRGTTVLLDALVASDYLAKTGDPADPIYTVQEQFVELLDSRTPETFVPMIRHLACVQRSWTQLARAVKDGTPPERPSSILGEDQDRVSFIWAMNSIARTLVGPTIESLRTAGVPDFGKKNIRFLDIGGASGTYTEAFLRALPESEGTIFDLPVGIAAACKRFGGTDLESRVHLVEGDFYRDPLPGEDGANGFDFVWISAIIHQQGLVETRELFAKSFRAMVSGGIIAVRDFIMSPDRVSPKEGTYFGINMLVNTKTGMVYTFDEVREALESAGFTDVRHAVETETMSAIVVATKS